MTLEARPRTLQPLPLKSKEAKIPSWLGPVPQRIVDIRDPRNGGSIEPILSGRSVRLHSETPLFRGPRMQIPDPDYPDETIGTNPHDFETDPPDEGKDGVIVESKQDPEEGDDVGDNQS